MKKPDYHHQEEFQNRSRKLGDIRQIPVDPYPQSMFQRRLLKSSIKRLIWPRLDIAKKPRQE